MDEFIVGLDLGQSRDYTALAVPQRIAGARRAEAQYHLRHLERPPLGTLYTAIVERVKELLATSPLHARRTPLVIDRTGVGSLQRVGDQRQTVAELHSVVNRARYPLSGRDDSEQQRARCDGEERPQKRLNPDHADDDVPEAMPFLDAGRQYGAENGRRR